MFSRNKEAKETDVTPVPQPAAKRIARSSVPSIISADLTVNGTLVSSGDVQIDGRVEGDVRVASLVIGEKATIQGDIYAEDAIIRGRVNGSIRARKVQLCTTAHVEGNILHEALAVEAGAFFEGNCRHSDNPLAGEITDTRRPVPQAQPQIMAPSMAPKPAQPMATPIKPTTQQILDDTSRTLQARAANFTPLKG